MLLLTSSGDLVRVNTSAATDIEVHASWADNVSGTITPGRTNTPSITGTGDTTVVAGPSSGQRNVRHLNIRNNHGATTCNVLVSHFDGTEVESLMFASLLAGEALVFDEQGLWTHYKVDGSEYPKSGYQAATQAEMETGTSTERLVVPSVQQGHPSMAKFWVTALGTGSAYVPGVGTNFNLTSVTDTAAGRITFTIATDFSSANWCCIAFVERTSTTLTVTNLKSCNIRNATQAAGTVEIECYDGTATTAVQEDPQDYYVVGYGDQ